MNASFDIRYFWDTSQSNKVCIVISFSQFGGSEPFGIFPSRFYFYDQKNHHKGFLCIIFQDCFYLDIFYKSFVPRDAVIPCFGVISTSQTTHNKTMIMYIIALRTCLYRYTKLIKSTPTSCVGYIL
jgi:hypothetical protein